MMRALRITAVVVLAYVGVVAAFESLIGFFQPAGGTTLVITTVDESGPHDRVVSRLDSDGRVFVATNHWPRAWYRRARTNPDVQAMIDGKKAGYTAVPVSDAEHERVNAQHPLPLVFRILTGFPPRHFLRLDPVEVPG